jgi:hypothetical protein
VETFWTWTDHPGDLQGVLSRDQVLDAVTQPRLVDGG